MQVINNGTTAAPATQGLDLKKAAVIEKLKATMNPKPAASPPQAQETPVKDPSNISVEEMGAIRAPSTPETTEDSGQALTTESEAAPALEAPKAPDEPLSAQYAQLARKEKALRIEAQKMRAEREALKAEREALKPAPIAPVDRSKFIDPARFEADPLATLAELGISYDSLTQRALNAPTPDQIEYKQTVSRLEAKIAELEGKVGNTEKTFKQQQEDGYKQAIHQITNDVKSLVYSGDTYELTKATNSTRDVVELIERTFKEGLDDERPKGTLLGIEEAAQIVEDHLTEEAYKLAKLKKIQAKFKPSAVTPANPAKAADGTEPKQSQGQKTLTNSMATTKQYTAKQRAMFAAEHGPNWRSKVS